MLDTHGGHGGLRAFDCTASVSTRDSARGKVRQIAHTTLWPAIEVTRKSLAVIDDFQRSHGGHVQDVHDDFRDISMVGFARSYLS